MEPTYYIRLTKEEVKYLQSALAFWPDASRIVPKGDEEQHQRALLKRLRDLRA